MKTRIFFIIGVLLLTINITSGKEAETGYTPSMNGSINVVTSPDLYALTSIWAKEYCKQNPALTINVQKYSGTNIAGMLKSTEGLGIVSNESIEAQKNLSLWNIVIGRDVIVPVINEKNPFLQEINKKGITSEEFGRIFANPEDETWGMLLGNNQNTPLHCYLLDDSSVKNEMANFLNNKSLNITGIYVKNGQELITAIQKDPNSLGFCKLIHAVDPANQCLADKIKLVPIDKNRNGKIDYMENIYANLQTFTRGVWIGKYPKALSGNIYMASSIKPSNETELAFMRWVLADGQQFLNPTGYSDLVINERQTQLAKLNHVETPIEPVDNENYAILKIVVMILIAFGILGFVFDLVSRPFRKKKEVALPLVPELSFNEDSVEVPRGLYFDKSHTWAFMEKDGTVKIGIDDFLHHVTGPLSRIGMKPVGVKIKKGGPLLTIIQKGKHLTIYSPVSGTIKAYNDSLITNSSALNSTPYCDGWVYSIEPTNWLREIQFLSMSEKYKVWLKEEFLRLKDFIAAAINPDTPEYAHVVLQDGGALKDSILADLGPEVWEDFQIKFIDTAK
jgi:glycine cleavage system H lipoate-binding protein/ABC-type phosphate transport system substrate-binding protein